MRLLADCGNTSLKFARWPAGRSPELMEPVGPNATSIARIVGDSSQYDELILMPVNDDHAALAQRWWGRGPLRVLGKDLAAPDFGQYQGCGLDRVCAGLAATHRHGPCIVVDAGTAVTISAWQVDDAGLPSFAGGMIVPSPRACMHGLTDLAPRLPAPPVQMLPDGPLQHSTEGALLAPYACYDAWIQSCTAHVVAASGLDLVVACGEAGQWLPEARLEQGLAILGLAEWTVIADDR